MNGSYLVRLACLSLASFAVLTAAAGAILSCASPLALRLASRMPAGPAARFLFLLRISPAALAAAVVGGLCIPSYLWLEPQAPEEIGIICGAAASLALFAIGRSAVRSIRAILDSRRYLQSCRDLGEPMQLAGQVALVIPGERTTVLAGLFRPYVVISRDVVAALPPDQLEAAVLHERAHAAARDNVKRLAMLLTPEVFPLRRIDQGWKKFSEWAADDRAAFGDPSRSVGLAEALVRVARMGTSPQTSALTTSLLGDDFSGRIDRLLNAPAPAAPSRWRPIAAAFLAFTLFLLRPSTFDLVHRVLERLMR